MENKKENELSNVFWYIVIGICLFFIVVVGIGLVVFSNRKPEVVDKKLNGGNIILNYTDNITGLSIVDATPTTDSIGMKNSKDGQYFDFSIEVHLENAKTVEYEVAAIKDASNSTISDDDIKIYLEKENSGTYTKVFKPAGYVPIERDTELGSPEGSMVLARVKQIKDSTDNYRLRMWISDKSVTKKGNYTVEIVVNGKAK